ncbi:MAG: glycosyltransferase, partial [Candidatus Omnitrophica bacterium]|nr:glycosyltransferase [Candidatus Omnitrophota bacterium]
MNRLGLVIGQLSWGGAERQLHELATRIQAEGFVPTVYCLSEDIEPYGPMLRDRGISVRVFPRRSHFDLGRAWALRRALAADEVDLAHAWLVNDDAYAALAHIGGPRPWVASMRSRPLDRDGLRKRIDRWTFRRADRVVVNESEVIDFLERELGCPRSKVTLIPNGVDFERLLGSRSREAVRSELNTPLDSPALQFAGRLEGVVDDEQADEQHQQFPIDQPEHLVAVQAAREQQQAGAGERRHFARQGGEQEDDEQGAGNQQALGGLPGVEDGVVRLAPFR